MANKNILIGIGVSKDKDSYVAATQAAEQSIKECGGQPTFSFVYTNSNFDQKKILLGINEFLGKNWVGCTVDKQISSKSPYDEDDVVTVMSLRSDYIHFGVGVADNYKKNPSKAGQDAIKEAMKKVKSDKVMDSFIQFTRAKKLDYSQIVKTPPYFIFTIASSQTKQNGAYIGGEETHFLEGILKHTGPHVPVFGVGAGSDFDKFIDSDIKDMGNFQFANGKMYSNAGVVVFTICNTHFEINVTHGYTTTSDFVVVTKIDKTGFEILELNGKEPISEYCRILGIDKKNYLKEPENYSLPRPFGLIALDGKSYIKVAFPNPDNKTLHCTHKLNQNSVMNVLQSHKEGLVSTMTKIIEDSLRHNHGHSVAISLFCNCCSRRLLMKGEEAKASQILNAKHKKVPYFGCYAFSEIGSTKTNIAQVHGETVTSLIIFNELLTEK
jgi:hypothetical protein